LIGLSEGVMVNSSDTVVPETAEVCLRSLLFFNGHCNDFDLVICKSDFNFKSGWHYELISVDGIIIVRVLLLDLFHISLHLLLLGIHAFHVHLLLRIHSSHISFDGSFHLTVHLSFRELIIAGAILQRLLGFSFLLSNWGLLFLCGLFLSGRINGRFFLSSFRRRTFLCWWVLGCGCLFYRGFLSWSIGLLISWGGLFYGLITHSSLYFFN